MKKFNFCVNAMDVLVELSEQKLKAFESQKHGAKRPSPGDSPTDGKKRPRSEHVDDISAAVALLKPICVNVEKALDFWKYDMDGDALITLNMQPDLPSIIAAYPFLSACHEVFPQAMPKDKQLRTILMTLFHDVKGLNDSKLCDQAQADWKADRIHVMMSHNRNARRRPRRILPRLMRIVSVADRDQYRALLQKVKLPKDDDSDCASQDEDRFSVELMGSRASVVENLQNTDGGALVTIPLEFLEDRTGKTASASIFAHMVPASENESVVPTPGKMGPPAATRGLF